MPLNTLLHWSIYYLMHILDKFSQNLRNGHKHLPVKFIRNLYLCLGDHKYARQYKGAFVLRNYILLKLIDGIWILGKLPASLLKKCKIMKLLLFRFGRNSGSMKDQFLSVSPQTTYFQNLSMNTRLKLT